MKPKGNSRSLKQTKYITSQHQMSKENDEPISCRTSALLERLCSKATLHEIRKQIASAGTCHSWKFYRSIEVYAIPTKLIIK